MALLEQRQTVAAHTRVAGPVPRAMRLPHPLGDHWAVAVAVDAFSGDAGDELVAGEASASACPRSTRSGQFY